MNVKKLMATRKRRARKRRTISDAERAEARAAQVALAKLDLSHRDLAKRTGLAPGTVANVLTCQHPWWPAKVKINQALGRPIFTRHSPRAPTGEEPDGAGGAVDVAIGGLET